METKETTVNGAVKIILSAIRDSLINCLGFALKSVLKFDKKILKRYFNIETPLYKLWWEAHSKSLQKKLNTIHGADL